MFLFRFDNGITSIADWYIEDFGIGREFLVSVQNDL
jgi:hypothetical protein